jgi:hypothetical protein
MTHVNRVVIGVSEGKKSAVVYRDSPNQQEVPAIYWQSTLWATTELPVNNQAPGDRGADVTVREPQENGLIFRALEIPPHIQDAQKVTESSSPAIRRSSRASITPGATSPTSPA